jgi:hypothetical protein
LTFRGLRRLHFRDIMSVIHVQESLVDHGNRCENIVGKELRVQPGGHLDVIIPAIAQMIFPVLRQIREAEMAAMIEGKGVAIEVDNVKIFAVIRFI